MTLPLTDEAYFAIKERAAPRLLKIPGVHSVGLGGRERKGEPTGEPVIKVFLLKKRPAADVAPAELIPAQFEGVATDVVECGRDVLLSDPPPGGELGTTFFDDGRYRALRGGTQLQGANRRNPGTLGFFVQTAGSPSSVLAVTVHHALFFDESHQIPDMKVGQPSPDESMTKCCTSVIGKFAFGHFDSVAVRPLDCALIRLDPGMKWLAEIKNVGLVRGTHSVTMPEATTQKYRVRKRGRTTVVTGGVVTAIGVSGTDDETGRTWNNGMRIKPNPNTTISGTVTFADFGDSGSPVVNQDNEIVGMVFAGTTAEGDPEIGFGTAVPIQDILQRFKESDALTLTVATATELGDVREAQGASSAATALDAEPAQQPVAVVPWIEDDLTKTEPGKLLLEMWLRHSPEMLGLVNTNAQVTARWRRAKGPLLLHSMMRVIGEPGRAAPRELEGRPVEECVDDIADLFVRYGSSDLGAAIARCRPMLPRFGGKAYGDLLRDLGSGQ